jgi:hypothetical protein
MFALDPGLDPAGMTIKNTEGAFEVVQWPYTRSDPSEPKTPAGSAA